MIRNYALISVLGELVSSDRLKPFSSFAHTFHQILSKHHLAHKKYYLGLSGGMDSLALAHLLHQHNINFYAIHINHKLHQQSKCWQVFCEDFCKYWKIPLISKTLTATPSGNLEAWAREQRMHIFSEIAHGEVLMTAHHQNDQVETILFKLLRAEGLGMSAMNSLYFRQDYGFWHFRPLLQISQNSIAQYLQEQQLNWIDDPSNDDLDFDRNFLRHQIIPNLAERFPAALDNIVKACENIFELRKNCKLSC